ncbi:MAG TPA: FtsX-like permease family protein [candidate division WOR-3 bacterium]|uniref:Cell division protein FtsX n=1 Tax=candidate division WOR-3 bacterium TaxID=2052148 RepID=A0A9C9EMQ4_UNCW3|nr:FtsX-like permease family protein [candidate division WOR-3 bacterium]
MSLRIGIREGFRTITRNSSLFLLSLLLTSISLFLLSLFALVTVNLYYFLNILDQKIEIIAFLDTNADVDALKSNILKINGVKEVIYISSDEALKNLQNELKETEEVLNVFERNPLPASLRIKLGKKFRNARGLEEISDKVMLLRGIKETIYGGELVEQLKKITNIVTVFDFGLLLIIIFSVIFVIFQTIKLTIFARSTEIEIMKLVGASNSFIAIPFTFEGIVQGIIGGVIAFVLTVITNKAAVSFFSEIYFPQWWFLLGNVASGMIFGVIGSALALRRFLQ